MAAARGIAAIVARRRAARGLHHPVACSTATWPTPSPPRSPSEAKREGAAEADAGRDRLRGRGRREAPRRAVIRPPASDRTRRMTRVTVTGATGLIGSRLVRALRERGDEVTVLSRSPDGRARRSGRREAAAWDPAAGPAPAEALAGRDAVVHLAGEDVAQRWNDERQAPHPRVARAGHAQPRRGPARPPSRGPRALVSSSAVGYYGPHGDEPSCPRTRRPATTSSPSVCVAWEREAQAAEALGAARRARAHRRRARPRRRRAGEDAARSSRLGVGGPVAGGAPAACRGSTPTTSSASTCGAIDDERWSGRGQRHGARAGHQQGVLEGARPRAAPARVAPVPGVRDPAPLRRHGRDRHQGPERRARAATLELGYRHAHPDLDEALRSALRSD